MLDNYSLFWFFMSFVYFVLFIACDKYYTVSINNKVHTCVLSNNNKLHTKLFGCIDRKIYIINGRKCIKHFNNYYIVTEY